MDILTLQCIDHAHDEQQEYGAHADYQHRHLTSTITQTTFLLLGTARFTIHHGKVHGTGYGNGIQIFGAYILQIGIRQ